jgi:hypothetical protein
LANAVQPQSWESSLCISHPLAMMPLRLAIFKLV